MFMETQKSCFFIIVNNEQGRKLIILQLCKRFLKAQRGNIRLFWMGLRNGGKSLLLLTFSNINKVLAKRSFPKNWVPIFENAQQGCCYRFLGTIPKSEKDVSAIEISLSRNVINRCLPEISYVFSRKWAPHLHEEYFQNGKRFTHVTHAFEPS